MTDARKLDRLRSTKWDFSPIKEEIGVLRWKVGSGSGLINQLVQQPTKSSLLLR